MFKIVIELLLVTLILNEAICFPTKHQILLSEKNQTSRVSRHPMRRRICTIKFRLMPKMALSFTTDFMMFKRPRIVCSWVKTQSEKKIPKDQQLQNLQQSLPLHHNLQQECLNYVVFILNLLLCLIFVMHT